MLTIALIGAGRIGQIHAHNIVTHRRAKLFGICDINVQAAHKLASSLGSRVLPLNEAFAADAILIASSTPTHADMIDRATLVGRPVFCEKPIDLNETRVRACLEGVREEGIPLMVGFNRRFDPHFRALKQRLDSGAVGGLEILTITSRDQAPPPRGYIAQSGGLFRDMMIHDFDMARFLLAEEPVELFATGSCLVDTGIAAAGDIDSAAVLLKTASGKICQISNSRRAIYGFDQRIEIHAANGMLRAENPAPTSVVSATQAGLALASALPALQERYAESYRAELDAFIAGILDGTPVTPDGEDGLRALLLADAATESYRTGKLVRL